MLYEDCSIIDPHRSVMCTIEKPVATSNRSPQSKSGALFIDIG